MEIKNGNLQIFFPVALGEIGLDWGSNDTIEEFTVDLAYDYWTSDFVG